MFINFQCIWKRIKASIFRPLKVARSGRMRLRGGVRQGLLKRRRAKKQMPAMHGCGRRGHSSQNLRYCLLNPLEGFWTLWTVDPLSRFSARQIIGHIASRWIRKELWRRVARVTLDAPRSFHYLESKFIAKWIRAGPTRTRLLNVQVDNSGRGFRVFSDFKKTLFISTCSGLN